MLSPSRYALIERVRWARFCLAMALVGCLTLGIAVLHAREEVRLSEVAREAGCTGCAAVAAHNRELEARLEQRTQQLLEVLDERLELMLDPPPDPTPVPVSWNSPLGPLMLPRGAPR